jgi:hypothetical protein
MDDQPANCECGKEKRTMTNQEIEQIGEAVKAWLRKEPIQFKDKNGKWGDVNNNYNILFVDSEKIYRIKPQPEFRPWRPEEVPLGCYFRSFQQKIAFQPVIYPDGTFLRPPNCGTIGGVWIHCTLEKALDEYEHSIDGGKTWLPCGAEEKK